MVTSLPHQAARSRISLVILLGTAITLVSHSQDTSVRVPTSPRPAAAGNAQGAPALEATKNKDVARLLGEAQDLQSRHRYFDALAKLDEAEKLTPEDPNIFNIRGAIYLVPAVRDFEKAQEQFVKSQALAPDALAPKFNLAELLFVKHSFAEAEPAFAALLKEFVKLPMNIRHLVAFKLLSCQAEQKKISDAEKTLKAHFTFMDDTPAYYFAKAEVAFAQKKDDEAKDWLTKANTIFKPADNSAYLDSLMELRHVPNIMMTPVESK